MGRPDDKPCPSYIGAETLWVDYVLELAADARADPTREATTVVIGIHPFVVGTPDRAAAMRRVLLRLKMDDKVWITDTPHRHLRRLVRPSGASAN